MVPKSINEDARHNRRLARIDDLPGKFQTAAAVEGLRRLLSSTRFEEAARDDGSELVVVAADEHMLVDRRSILQRQRTVRNRHGFLDLLVLAQECRNRRYIGFFHRRTGLAD